VAFIMLVVKKIGIQSLIRKSEQEVIGGCLLPFISWVCLRTQ
jgi:hypothetical protein